MKKTDRSIHNVCVAKIKRSTMKPYDFRWAKFFEDSEIFGRIYPDINIGLGADELVICSTVIDSDNFSVVTTQRLITKENGMLQAVIWKEATRKSYGDFKGYEMKPVTVGTIILADGSEMKYFIETGRASMIMVQGVSTRMRLTEHTPTA